MDKVIKALYISCLKDISPAYGYSAIKHSSYSRFRLHDNTLVLKSEIDKVTSKIKMII